MFSQDYFPYVPESGSSTHRRDSTQPLLFARNPCTSSNAFLRELLGPTISLSTMPPSCRTISSSHWCAFTTAPEQITPAGELKASNLLRDGDMASTYNPPADEWCYLGANQPDLIPQHMSSRVQDHGKRQRGVEMSWATVSEQDESARPKPTTTPIQFSKQAPTRVNTSSELTASFDTKSNEKKRTTLAERFAFEGLNCQELPSAFESDDEEEHDDNWIVR
ncbi:hypothetical protein G6011_03090 [Alternaria panax]|uniref:Uncharacterized protein n=1 Tax=Alternaria panax TaxID=48097 RepID=A0AAD4IED6_9PLEO|nr:hypothetical protein G6011_03090 [Alternaria panax]